MTVTPIPAGRTAVQPSSRRVAELLRGAWSRFVAWRERRRAVAHLRSLSDSQLRDLGITRMEIERLVRGGAGGARHHSAWSLHGER